MLNSRLQNMKQSAYLDYFKSFSVNANDTLKKLEQEFKQQIEDSLIFDNNSILKKIKTLLGSYEILIYQINDSCEFVQIPQFGMSLMRIFLQVMSVVKFLLVKLAEKQQKIIKNSQQQEQQQHSSQTVLKFQRLPSPSYRKKTSVLHHPIIQVSSAQFNNFSSNSNSQINQKQMYKQKQQSKFLMHTLKQELNMIELEESQNRQFSKKQLKALIQGKQRLQAIQTSQNQNILTQTLNSFCKKGQYLKNFVTVRQAAMVNNMKQSMSGNDGVLKVKDILDEDSTNKMNHASVKLQSLFKYHVQNYVKQKQSQMTSQQCQVNIDDTLDQLKVQESKQLKRFNQIIKRLQDDIQLQKHKNTLIENLLKSKIQEFQLKTMQYRVAKIEMDNLKGKLQKQKQKQLEKQMAKMASMTVPLQQKQENPYCKRCNERIQSVGSQNGMIKTQGQTQSKGTIEDDPLSSQQTFRKQFTQQSLNSDQQTQKDFQFVQNHSKLMEKINRSRVLYQTSTTNNLSKKNLISKFIYDSLQKKSQLLEICSKQLQLLIQPFKAQIRKQQRQPTRMLNISGSGGKKKTIFAGRPFQTASQEINNVTVQSVGTNNNDKKKKTKFLPQKGQNFSLQKVFSFCFGGNIRKQTHKNSNNIRQQKQSKLIEIKKYIKKLTEQPPKNKNDHKDEHFNEQMKQAMLQQLAQKILQQYQQRSVESRSLKKQQFPTESNLSSVLMRQKSQQSDQEFKKDIQQQRNGSIYKMTSYNYRLQSSQKSNNNRKSNNLLLTKNQSQSHIFRNSAKPNKVERNYELARVQSHNVLGMSPFGTKNSLKQQQSLTKFSQVSQVMQDSHMQSKHFQQTNIQGIVTYTFNQNEKYPKLLKFSQQQKVILTIKDLMNLFVDANTAKNIEYMNLFQNDEVKITSTIKIKRNQSLNPTQLQLKKKNLANGLLKRTVQQHKNQKGIVGSEEHTNIGIHASCSIGMNLVDHSPKKDEERNSASKRSQITINSNQDLNKRQLFLYSFEEITSLIFKHFHEIKKLSLPSSHLLTNYQTIRNFLRYPYSAVALANDKQFIQKQKHQSSIDYLQLKKILQRIFQLHQHCHQYVIPTEKGENNAHFEKLPIKSQKSYENLGKDKIEGNNLEKEIFIKQHQPLCKHLVEFFQKIGILFYPPKNFKQKEQK